MNTELWQLEQAGVIAAYTSRLQTHGGDVRSLNWGSRASQERRFEVIVEAGIKSGMSVLDVGCGLGDFLPWINLRGIQVEYTGLDITPDMVAACRQKFPAYTFHEGDIVDWRPETDADFDFVIASGIFYDRPGSGYEYMQNAVRAMLRLCRTGVACNTITALADRPSESEFRPRIGVLAELCAAFTHRFILRHDYHPCDATLYLYKNDKP
jgi:SAM-dependent methyltransferase